MSLTIDAVKSEITANPAFKTEVFSSLKDDFLSELKTSGLIIRSADEEQEYLTNYEKNIIPGKVEAQIGQKVKEVHDRYDTDLFEITGEKKNPNEKTYDFLKRKITELKNKPGKTDSVDADKIRQMEEKLNSMKDYVSPDEITKLKNEFFGKEVSGKVIGSLSQLPIAVPPHITDEKAKQDYAAMQRNMIKADFLSRFIPKQDKDGNVVYYLDETLQTNPQTAKPLTEAELIAANYAGYFVPPATAKTGMGSGSGGQGGNVDVNEVSLKTKLEVQAFLNKKGLNSGSREFNKEYSRILTAYAITQ